MIPWLLVTELMSKQDKTLAQLVDECIAAFPCSGEINNRIEDPAAAIAKVESHFADQGATVDRTDGLSMDFGEWRFNLRMSNTEPVVRLNVESRADESLMQVKRDELLQLLTAH